MTTRNFFFFLWCALYIVAIILYAMKIIHVSTVIWLSLSMVCFVGLYVSSAPRKEK